MRSESYVVSVLYVSDGIHAHVGIRCGSLCDEAECKVVVRLFVMCSCAFVFSELVDATGPCDSVPGEECESSLCERGDPSARRSDGAAVH